GMSANVNFAGMLMKRLTFTATTLRARSNDEKGAIRDAVAKEVWPLIERGRIKPVIDKIFPLAEAQAAHKRMSGGEHIGKILLSVWAPRLCECCCRAQMVFSADTRSLAC